MIYGTERDARKAKKIDGESVEPCKMGKKPLDILKNNNNQTFTIYRYSILFARIRKILKIKIQNSIFAKFLTRLAQHLLISLTKLFAPQTSVLKNVSRGYVMVLVAVFIPVILLGTKLVLDSRQEATTAVGRVVKRCAKECALKVAQNWNPGLSYKQQKESMLRLADEIYNASPAYNTATYKYNAIPGLEMPTKAVVTKQGMYKPLKVETSQTISLAPSSRVVEYESVSSNKARYYTTEGGLRLDLPVFDLFHVVYTFSEKDPNFVLEDTLSDFTIEHSSYRGLTGRNTLPFFTMRKLNASKFSPLAYNMTMSGSEISATTTRRKNANDTKVQIWVENDKIKVKTDEDVAYAVPAECNVDIVLGIPVNGASRNVSNNDANTPTTGEGYWSTSNTPTNDAKTTPIYQISRGFIKIIKENFYHTRGTNIGIVPYCGRVSIPLARSSPTSSQSWVVDPDNFNSSYFLSNQNAYPAYIRSCMLYGTGVPMSPFTTYWTHWGLMSFSASNILARKGYIEKPEAYGYNTICYGDLLSTADPKGADSSNYSPKFMRHHVYGISGFPGRANFLSMSWEGPKADESTWTTPNAYHIVELQSDLQKVTDLLNLFYPSNTNNGVTNNVFLSNFIFIPFTWANNLFQSWSNDPKFDAKDTTADSTNLGRLAVQSKSTSNRKKAVIVVVNKPDWFEPGELTYLGYDNDFSELPMIESDCIRGDIDYSSGSGNKFADGSDYDGTVQGAKKILKLTGFSRNSTTGYYECGDGDATLTFPKKYLIKIVVEPICVKTASLKPPREIKMAAYYNGKYIAVTTGPHCRLYTSTNATTWAQGADICGADSDAAETYVFGYNNGKYIHSTKYWGEVRTSSDLSSWACPGINGVKNIISGTEYNDKYIMVNYSGDLTYTINGGSNWTSMGTKLADLAAKSTVEWITSNNGMLIAGSGTGWVSRSFDGGNTWSTPVQGLASMNSSSIWQCRSGNGKFIALESNFKVSESYDGITWSKPTTEVANSTARSCAYGHAGWVFITYSGDVYLKSGTIKFTNLKTATNQLVTPETTYSVSDKQEFYIEPSQINGGSDGAYTITFSAQNLRLISAEITNRPYVSVTPTVTQSGNVFILNAKVPFVVTTNQDGTISYTAANGTATTQYVSNSWGYVQVTPESHQYVKTYDSNNNPVYKVTLTHSKGSSAIVSATIGLAEEHTETKSGLTIDHESAGTKSKVSMGSCLSYQKTDIADSTNHKATIDKTNKRILCPLGTILHVKAKPTGTATTVFPIMAPLGTIKFKNCPNESNMTHELYKEWNFCIEPSQMKSNGDSSNPMQYVEYEMSNCNIDDSYYEYQNYSTIALTKTNDVPMARWSITGHKKEMVWNKCSKTLSTTGMYGSAQKIRFDGTRCYFGSIDGDILYSDDYGKTWAALGNKRPASVNRLMFSISPLGLHFVDYDTGVNYLSTDNGQTWKTVGGFNSGSGWFEPFIYSFNANETSKAMAVRGSTSGNYTRGTVLVSSDCITWSGKTSCDGVLSVGNANYFFGLAYHNGSWFNRSNGTPSYLGRSTDGGSSWSRIDWNPVRETFMTYGSNLMMVTPGHDFGSNVVFTCTDSNMKNFTGHSVLPYTYVGGIWYANGNFISHTRTNDVQFAYTTYHDGVVGVNRYYSYSQEVSSSTTHLHVGGNLTAFISNLIVTSISGTYVKIVKQFPRAIEFKKLRLPDMSRVIDFTKKASDGKFVYNICGTEYTGVNNFLFYANALDGDISRIGIRWNSSGYWEYVTSSGASCSQWNHYVAKNFIGDMFVITNGNENSAPYSYYNLYEKNQSNPSSTVHEYVYMVNGMFRIFSLSKNTYKTFSQFHHGWEVWGLGSKSLPIIMGGLTLPINAMLYAGYYDGAYHKGAWYKDQSGNASYEATDAVKNVTKAACAKLKSDWGSNIRIYLIKYRKQTQYKHKITGSATNFDYSYLNDCSTGTSAPYMYDISSESDLNTALSAIAANIKDWAGYKRAENK